MENLTTLDYGYRSKCCLAPIRVGTKKIKKINQKITVWVCCSCHAKDVQIITREEAKQIKEKDWLKPDIDSDDNYSDEVEE